MGKGRRPRGSIRRGEVVKGLRQALARLLALGSSRRMDQELDDELAAHLEMAEQDAIRSGLSPEEARRQARVRLGGVQQVREEQREQRSAQWLETFMRDVRYALASLARDRAFTIIAVSILALGIGANAAMFSLIDAVLLKPMPFPNPERVVRVWEAPTPTTTNQVSPNDFIAWKDQSTAFAAFSAEARTRLTTIIGGEPVRIFGKIVSADYFDVFRIAPLLGRTFQAGEDQPGASPVVVLSHSAWQARFGSDPAILGRELVLNGTPHRIVGVMPSGTFDRDDLAAPGQEPAQFFKPLVFTPRQRTETSHWLVVAARVRDEATIAQGEQQLRATQAVLARDFPDFKKKWSVVVEPFDARLKDNTLQQSLYAAFGAVVLVLLIACANVANLLLGRGAARQKEMAVRAALGAGRGRLVRQLLTETLVLCLLGTAAGLVIASYLIAAAGPLLPHAIPSTAVITLDYRVFAFASVAAVGVTLLVGLLPSLRTSSGSLAAALNHAARGSSSTRGRLRQLVVVAEMALSLILICGALLLFKSLLNLQHVDLGVRKDHVVTISTELPAIGYPTPESAAGLFRTLIERLEAVPGVEQASLADDAPLEGAGGENLRMPGVTDPVLVRYKRVGPGYFSALDVPLIAGREFSGVDHAGSAPVTIISQELARELRDRFGVKEPVGATVSLPVLAYDTGGTRTDFQVIGVIRGERVQRDLRLPLEPVAYVPLSQSPRRAINLIIHTSSDTASVVPSIRDEVRRIDSTLVLSDVRTMEDIRRQRSLNGAAEPAWLIGAFAIAAAFLAGLGLYGVLGHAVLQQRREIGIRMALGASSGEILSRVLTSAGLMVSIGLGAGLCGALALTRIMSNLLFGVSPLDPWVLASATVAMALVGLVAAALPASRAVRVDPTTALRSEG
jgi:putative ABC transport system permease protein